jgi:hypothetical protein
MFVMSRYILKAMFLEKLEWACLECRKTFMFLRFSYEIEPIPVKLLSDSCGIPTFQTGHCNLEWREYKLCNDYQ